MSQASDPQDPPLTPLSMAILLALADGDLHGYALLQEVEHQSAGRLRPGTGTLYAALQRLDDEGLIVESPDLPGPDEDQRRRYFRLTGAGFAAARAEAERMLGTVRAAAERRLLPEALRAALEDVGT
jgi:DNA-binding PadR family transcriptional regulator